MEQANDRKSQLVVIGKNLDHAKIRNQLARRQGCRQGFLLKQ